jgi:hypothetical protein
VYVRASKDQPVVDVFSILLGGVQPTPALMEAVNDLNRQYPYTTALYEENVLLLRPACPAAVVASPRRRSPSWDTCPTRSTNRSNQAGRHRPRPRLGAGECQSGRCPATSDRRQRKHREGRRQSPSELCKIATRHRSHPWLPSPGPTGRSSRASVCATLSTKPRPGAPRLRSRHRRR